MKIRLDKLVKAIFESTIMKYMHRNWNEKIEPSMAEDPGRDPHIIDIIKSFLQGATVWGFDSISTATINQS